MFDDYTNLRRWRGAAEILAKDENWNPLYDLEQLTKNEVKVSAVTCVSALTYFESCSHSFFNRYFNDMYVDFEFAQKTAAQIKNIGQYITNQLVRDGIREDPADVMKKLFKFKLSRREFD